MPRLTKSIPRYRLHKASGQAVVTLSGKDFYLGRHDSPESHAEYRRLVAEWLEKNRVTSPAQDEGEHQALREELTINELFLSYWGFVETYYVKNGTPTGEQHALRYALKPLVDLYGNTRVADFGPARLKTVRQAMVDQDLCRNLINSRVKRIRRLFKWGVENELVHASILHALQAVSPLKRGRSKARETEPVTPVSEAHVRKVLPFMSAQIAAMVQLQLLTGMRPGELVTMRTRSIDISGKIWIYRPDSHKTEHHGRNREIYLGPRAQAILKPLLKTDLDAYLFSPAETEAQRDAERSKRRRTPMTPSQAKRRPKRNPKRAPGDHYTVETYGRAIKYAIDKAFPPPEPLRRRKVKGGKGHRWETLVEWKARLGDEGWAELVAWQQSHRWSPNRLRHSAATHLRKQFGIEAARVVLGHSSAAVTEVYAELDLEKARRIMEQIG